MKKIDLSIHKNHSHLSNDDHVYFLDEYYPGSKERGFTYTTKDILYSKVLPNETKKKLGCKLTGISNLAVLLGKSIYQISDIHESLIIPIPPSKIRSHELYDDRLVKILEKLKKPLNYAEILEQKESRECCHNNSKNRSLNELLENYIVFPNSLTELPIKIYLFDDVITTGAHFKAAKIKLNEIFPDIPVEGIFLSRRHTVLADTF